MTLFKRFIARSNSKSRSDFELFLVRQPFKGGVPREKIQNGGAILNLFSFVTLPKEDKNKPENKPIRSWKHDYAIEICQPRDNSKSRSDFELFHVRQPFKWVTARKNI